MRSRVCGNCMGSGKELRFEEVGRDSVSVTVKTEEVTCHKCNGAGEVPMTVADGVRSMDDELLARLIVEAQVTTLELALQSFGIEFRFPEERRKSAVAVALKKLQQPWEEE